MAKTGTNADGLVALSEDSMGDWPIVWVYKNFSVLFVGRDIVLLQGGTAEIKQYPAASDIKVRLGAPDCELKGKKALEYILDRYYG